MEKNERITVMEERLNMSEELLERADSVLSELDSKLGEIKKLTDYYGSEEWFSDLEAFERGELQSDIRCGVLSEDLVYDIVCERRELALKMLDIAVRLLKD